MRQMDLICAPQRMSAKEHRPRRSAARCARTLPVFVTESIQAGCRTGLAPDGPIVASRTRHAADGVVL